MGRSRYRTPNSIMDANIFDLPDHILVEILTRLPMKTICDCRCVCKYLRKIILDPAFIEPHLSRSPTTLMLHKTNAFDLNICLIESVEPFVIDTGHNHNIPPPHKTTLKFKPNFDVPLCGSEEVLSCCNGLICFYTPRTYNPYFICNPVVSEYVIVPQSKKDSFDQCGSGFGFSPRTNQYKVLRFLNPTPLKFGLSGFLKLETEINTVGTNTWRNVGGPPHYLHWLSSGCYLNGALHWIVHNADNCFESMCCFDFGNEKFQPFPGPTQFAAAHDVTVHQMNVGLLGDCLSVFHHSSAHQLDIWVMKNYGVKESWTKERVIELSSPSSGINYGNPYQPIMFIDNGEILMLYALSQLLSCNPRDGKFKSVKISGIPLSFKATAYTPSFVSIKNAVMGDTHKLQTSQINMKSGQKQLWNLGTSS